MLVIELNEFNPDYLKREAYKLNLKNILFFLNFKHSYTFTKEEKEHHGLDPWVQWVSIHSGRPFSEHKIGRLGQTKIQNNAQIWNRLSNINSTQWGVWGVMNAPCGGSMGRNFFVPDPWSFDEEAYPEELNDFLSLPKYIAKNYLSPIKKELLSSGLITLNFVLRNLGYGLNRKIFRQFVKAIYTTGINIHSLTTLMDYASCLYFLKFSKSYNNDFKIIFLNHLAHLQHHFWNLDDLSSQMKFGLIICDQILGEIKKDIKPDESIIILNGIRQINVAQKGHFVYRQKDPLNFIRNICPVFCKVEQNMTHDGFLLFKNSLDLDKAEKLLKNIKLKIKKNKLLFIEKIDKKTLFYQLDVYEKIDAKEKILLPDKEIEFFEYLEVVAERTGAHIQIGDIFSRNIDFPDKIENHEVFKYIENNFLEKSNM